VSFVFQKPESFNSPCHSAAVALITTMQGERSDRKLAFCHFRAERLATAETVEIVVAVAGGLVGVTVFVLAV